MRTVLLLALVIAVGALIGAGLRQATSQDAASDPAAEAIRPSPAEVEAALAGSPPPLAALHAQANELLGGGRRALDRRIEDLRGHPVVVNVWASWCGPCRAEMPIFQRVALARGDRIGFLGVDLRDNRRAARRFLARTPLTYPSYEDPDGEIYNGYRLAGAPSTIYYDARGERTFIHQGPYTSQEDFERDIDRYALGSGEGGRAS